MFLGKEIILEILALLVITRKFKSLTENIVILLPFPIEELDIIFNVLIDPNLERSKSFFLLIKTEINIKTIKKAITIIIVFKSYVDCILLPPKQEDAKVLPNKLKLVLSHF